MSLLVAKDALRATTIGGSGQTSVEHDQSTDPGNMAEPLALPTDLGSIEHLFASGPTQLRDLAAAALGQATDSIRGPHGGLIPSSLQHAAAAGVSRVDGNPVMSVPANLAQSATPFADAIRTGVARVRSAIGA
jgi:hypothetical protein